MLQISKVESCHVPYEGSREMDGDPGRCVNTCVSASFPPTLHQSLVIVEGGDWFPGQQAPPLLDVRELHVRKARRLPASILPEGPLDTNEQEHPLQTKDHHGRKQLPISLFTRTLLSDGSGLVVTPPHNCTDMLVDMSDGERQSPGHPPIVLTCQCASGGVCWVGLEDFLFCPKPHPSNEDDDFLNWV